jgi:hypothetical protein
MASVVLSRRVGKVVGYPTLSDTANLRARELIVHAPGPSDGV